MGSASTYRDPAALALKIRHLKGPYVSSGLDEGRGSAGLGGSDFLDAALDLGLVFGGRGGPLLSGRGGGLGEGRVSGVFLLLVLRPRGLV